MNNRCAKCGDFVPEYSENNLCEECELLIFMGNELADNNTFDDEGMHIITTNEE